VTIFYPDGNGGRITLDGGGASCTCSGGEYTLPTASNTIKGGVKIGYGLAMNGDTLNVTLQTGGGSTSQASSYGKVIDILPDYSAELDIANADDWAAFNQAVYNAQTGWSGYVYVVLPKQFAANNYTIENVHNESDYSIIYPKSSLTGTEFADYGYELFLLDGNRYVLQIPAIAIKWQTNEPTTQLIINGERQTATATTSGGFYFVPGDGLAMNGDTLNVTLNPAINFKIGDGLAMDGDTLNVTLETGELPTMSETLKGGAKVGHGLIMTGEVLNVALGTTPSTLEGAMWIHDEGG